MDQSIPFRASLTTALTLCAGLIIRPSSPSSKPDLKNSSVDSHLAPIWAGIFKSICTFYLQNQIKLKKKASPPCLFILLGFNFFFESDFQNVYTDGMKMNFLNITDTLAPNFLI